MGCQLGEQSKEKSSPGYPPFTECRADKTSIAVSQKKSLRVHRRVGSSVKLQNLPRVLLPGLPDGKPLAMSSECLKLTRKQLSSDLRRAPLWEWIPFPLHLLYLYMIHSQECKSSIEDPEMTQILMWLVRHFKITMMKITIWCRRYAGCVRT
jgi:hypothetical protein